MDINQTFENGVALYTGLCDNVHSFCLSLWVRRGSLHDPEKHYGLAHFLEHVVFRNISVRLDNQLYAMLGRMCLCFDGCTYSGYVRFEISGPSRYFEAAMDILLMTLLPIDVSIDQLDLERRRVKAEILENDDENTADYYAHSLVWKGTPLVHSIIGTPDALNRIGFDRLKQEHARWFSKGNFFFCATGNIPQMDQLVERLEAIVPFESDAVVSSVVPLPEGFFKRNAQIDVQDKDYTWLRFCFDLDTAHHRIEEYVLLREWLFGRSARFYMDLSENTGLVYGVDDCFEGYENIGSLCFDFEVAGKQCMPAIQAVVQLLNDIKHGGDETLINKQKAYIENMDIFREDPEYFNDLWGYDNGLKGCGYANIEACKAEYAAILPEQIYQLAREVFRPENLVLVVRGNKRRLCVDDMRKCLLLLSGD